LPFAIDTEAFFVIIFPNEQGSVTMPKDKKMVGPPSAKDGRRPYYFPWMATIRVKAAHVFITCLIKLIV
jgi:hypothetical protein